MVRTRFRRILFFFGRVILGVIFWDIALSRLGFRSLARRTRPARMRKIARRFRMMAVDMGGVMIKVGQFMSTRLDVLPRDITNELTGLQDEVKPEPFEDIRKELEASLKSSIDSKFISFEEESMASASIGQAHRAHVLVADEEGQEQEKAVVVKVQRPNIENIIETDLAALHIVSRWMDRYPPIRKHVNVPALLEELDRSTHEEMDYIQEGKNAETFAFNFQDRSDVIVPRIYWEFTTKKVITLEDVQAIKITDFEAIEAAGIDRNEVAERLLDTYLKQVLDDKFFHADPHPGNLFIHPIGEPVTEGRRWKLVFIDFGMVGQISHDVMVGLREVIIAISTGDAHRLVQADQLLNFLLPTADLDLLERAYQRVFDSFWGKSTTDMVKMHKSEAAVFLRDFRQLIFDMPFQFPDDMILLGRCFSILSGMCTGLNPTFNFWTSLGPYAQKLVEQEASSGVQFWLKELVDVLTTTLTLPKKVDGMIRYLEGGKLQVQMPELNQKIAQMERTQSRLTGAIFFSAFLLASVQLYLADEFTLAVPTAAAAGICLLIVLLKR